MQNYIWMVNAFHEGNLSGISFIENQLTKHLENNEENQTEIEHILDFLYSNQDKDYSSIGYKTIKEKADKWTKKMNESYVDIDEMYWEDIEILKEYSNGFKIVKLLSESAYKREGNMMWHCVASYFGRDTEVFSLRDSKNNPHCTIEKNQQIKGKGNSWIVEKYIEYVVDFLEFSGMNVRDSEMKNLGYTNISFYKQVAILKDDIKLFRDKYFYWDIKNAFRDDVEVHFCSSVSDAKDKKLI